LLDGVIREVFVGKWVTDPILPERHLYKFPRGTSVTDGATMCIVNLKRSLTIDEFRSVRREGIHPVISSDGEVVSISTILLTANLTATLPNGM
jgi:hypothetical protein